MSKEVFPLKVCPVCKKVFILAPMHSLTIRRENTIGQYTQEKPVCSWHCIRDWELKSGIKARDDRRKLAIEKELRGEM